MSCIISTWCVELLYDSFFFSRRRRHTRGALVTGVQTCARPIYRPGQARSATIRDPEQAHRLRRAPLAVAAPALILAPGSRICTAFGGLSGKVGKGGRRWR